MSGIDLFSIDDSALLPVTRGEATFWSPNEKYEQKDNVADGIEFSPPTNKETFHQLRTKYQVALSKMGKTVATHSKSTRIRRRQSFAISQMLQTVTQINSTPLKITSLDTERLVESMRKSTVKRKSMLPRSTKKSRVQALRRVSKNIDDIFAAHFADPEEDSAFANLLTQPTPHNRLSVKAGKRGRVALMDRCDDDPLSYLMPDTTAVDRMSLDATKNATTTTPGAGRKSAANTPRNSLCSPQPARTSAGTLVKTHAKSARKSTLGSAVRLRDQEMVTTSGAKANARSSIKPSAPSTASRKSFNTSRQSIGSSAPGTPMRSAVTPTAETPPFYTAAASVRRASIAPPTPVTTTATQRKASTLSFSAQKLKHTVATPLTNLRHTLQTNVELSVEKMGAFLQSMRKNDIRNRHAALSVTKTRDCASAAKTHRKPRPSAVRTLTFPEGDDCLSPAAAAVREISTQERAQRGYIYGAETELTESASQCEDPAGDESMLMDDVLGIDVQQMLSEYSRDIATGAAVVVESESEMDISLQDAEVMAPVNAASVSVSVPETEEPLQLDDCMMMAEEMEVEVEVENDQVEEGAAADSDETMHEDECMEVEDQGDRDVVNESCADNDLSALVEATCATYEQACAAESAHVSSPGHFTAVADVSACAEPNDEFTRLGNSGYNSDSSGSPQIVRLRYSAGSARRSLSNQRGRLSISAADLGCDISRLGVEASEQTSPLVFTAPVCKAAALLSAAVRNENANANLIAPIKTISGISTPRSMAKGPVRLIRSDVKPRPPQSMGGITPKAQLRGADLSDSDSELNASAQSDKRVRPGNAVSGNARRKSLASVSVSNLIKKFQTQAEKLQKGAMPAVPAVPAPAEVATAQAAPQTAESAGESEAAVSSKESTSAEFPRLTRSSIKASATKALLLQSPRRVQTETATTATKTLLVAEQSPRSHLKGKSQLKAKEVVAAVAAVEESETPQVKKSIRKGGRKSTAKKAVDATTVATSAPAAEVDLSAAVAQSELAADGSDDHKENATSAGEANVMSPLKLATATKAKLSAVKASVTKILASPVVASATRAYSLRSASKTTSTSAAASVAAEDDALPGNTAKVLFADEPEAPPTPTRAKLQESTAPKSTAKKGLGPPERRVLGRATPKSTKKGPGGAATAGAGTYTVAKAQRRERNQKLDSLFGTCEELLNLIDATVL